MTKKKMRSCIHLLTSGIVRIVAHQIVNLQLANTKDSYGDRKGKEYEPAKPFGETTEEQGDNPPTSYCQILLNDQLVNTYSTLI